MLIEQELTSKIFGAAIEVHRNLGPGLLESAYEDCLCEELQIRSIKFRRQVSIPALYKGRGLNRDYRIDLIVEEAVIVEVKAVERILGVHVAQTLTYLRKTGIRVALLLNFNVPAISFGIRRLVL